MQAGAGGEGIPWRVWHPLEAVDVQLPDERAQVVVLEVERQNVLRRRAKAVRKVFQWVGVALRAPPPPATRACRNWIDSE